ncbi:hypothetical protein M231_00083 [Tremella mesenterica]|uniref:Uncharacterized protein n=1 Tax=Tremella mesenterica TaxID=5217 RepID=A0A4Q1BWI5_TREME|nr:hypothetical protein M231_00083 [Tremella mesenterica]
MTTRASGNTCKPCYALHKSIVHLEPFAGSSLLACPTCGVVDEAATLSFNTVSVSEARGAILHEDEEAETEGVEWNGYKWGVEKAFDDRVQAIIGFHLEAFGHGGDENLRRGAWTWTRKILIVEKEKFAKKSILKNPNAVRLPYLVAVATKMAMQESSLLVLDSKLRRGNKHIAGAAVTKGDERVLVPTLNEFFHIAHETSPDHLAHLAKLSYFTHLHDRYSSLLHNSVSTVDACLSQLQRVIERIRKIANMTTEQLNANLITTPTHGRSGSRSWDTLDWAFFRRVESWDTVLQVAYNIFLAQECIDMFTSRSRIPAAVAVASWSVQAVLGDSLPQNVNILREITAQFGHEQWTACQYSVYLKRMFVAWSTSIDEARVPFPHIEPPQRGKVGNGKSGFGSDNRRGLPENYMATLAARTIADNWEKIKDARLKRTGVIPYKKEFELARLVFGNHAPKPVVKPVKPHSKPALTVAQAKRRALLPSPTPSIPLASTTTSVTQSPVVPVVLPPSPATSTSVSTKVTQHLTIHDPFPLSVSSTSIIPPSPAPSPSTILTVDSPQAYGAMPSQMSDLKHLSEIESEKHRQPFPPRKSLRETNDIESLLLRADESSDEDAQSSYSVDSDLSLSEDRPSKKQLSTWDLIQIPESVPTGSFELTIGMGTFQYGRSAPPLHSTASQFTSSLSRSRQQREDSATTLASVDSSRGSVSETERFLPSPAYTPVTTSLSSQVSSRATSISSCAMSEYTESRGQTPFSEQSILTPLTTISNLPSKAPSVPIPSNISQVEESPSLALQQTPIVKTVQQVAPHAEASLSKPPIPSLTVGNPGKGNQADHSRSQNELDDLADIEIDMSYEITPDPLLSGGLSDEQEPLRSHVGCLKRERDEIMGCPGKRKSEERRKERKAAASVSSNETKRKRSVGEASESQGKEQKVKGKGKEKMMVVSRVDEVAFEKALRETEVMIESDD